MEILFIGNSYTFYNDMPASLFLPLMREVDPDVRVTHLTKGGQRLTSSADPENVLGIKVAKALSTHPYDVVFLQEQSVTPALNPASFRRGVGMLLEKVRQNGAKPLLYSTWARRAGHKFYSDHPMSVEELFWRLAAAYDAVGKESNCGVAFAGLAFREALKTLDPSVLYRDDGSHPTPAGSFLAALTLASTLTGKDPCSFVFSGDLEEGLSDVLKAAARTAVFKTPPIPREFYPAF